MYSPSRPAVFAAGALLALAVVPASSALASGGDDAHEAGHHGLLLESALAGSLPGDTAVAKVQPGTFPWVLDHGTARVDAAGHLEVEVDGLIIPSLGKNPVLQISASLVCNGTTDSPLTAAVPFSPAGDAEIDAMITVPARCTAPVVLLHPNRLATTFIAISGQEA